DSESRLRFCGYDTLGYKLVIWTLAAVISGIAGALYVPIVGIINPSEMSPASSIEVAIWTAVGGRGTLLGPIIGAILVNGAKSFFTGAMADMWLFVLGGMFVFVTLFMPKGIIGVYTSSLNTLRARRASSSSQKAAGPNPSAATDASPPEVARDAQATLSAKPSPAE